LGLVELAKGLKENEKLENIDLCISPKKRMTIDNNVIGNEGALALAEVLKTHKSITDLGICMDTHSHRIS